jgi:hypothetical protein
MLTLKPILNKRYDENFSIAWIGNTPEKLSFFDNNNILVLKNIDSIYGITKINNYDDTIEGISEKQYLKKFFKINNSKENNWTEYLTLDELYNINIEPSLPFDIQIFYFFTYDDNPSINTPSNILIKYVDIQGTYKLQTTDSVALLTPENNNIILQTTDIYKVFSISDFQLISDGDPVNIKYRFTQNNGRTYSDWENLTTDNISSVKIDDTRFVQFQYLLGLEKGNLQAVVYDIILIGDFQNISVNYLKTNRFGIKEECLVKMLKTDEVNLTDIETRGLSCYKDVYTDLTYNQDRSNLFNPYKFNSILNFGNMLLNQMNNILGWNVSYLLRDPDGGGIDKYFHEQQLRNIIDMKDIKVFVDNNEFKSETILIDQLNLGMLDVLIVFITRDAFKEAFGIQKRPGVKDILYLCPVNRLFYVKHAQPYREIMGAFLYYKVVLEKYEKSTNTQFINKDAKNLIESLTKDTTIEELLTPTNKLEENRVANKLQTKSTAYDHIRLNINKNVKIINNDAIYCGNIDFIKNYYNINMTDNTAVTYDKLDTSLTKGEDRTLITWFNIKEQYDENKSLTKKVFDSYNINNKLSYNLLYNYNNDLQSGYKYFIEKDNVYFKLNDKNYYLNTNIFKNIWYGVLINLQQRQNKLTISLIKRNSNIVIKFFNKNTYESKELTTLTDLNSAYDINDNTYTYANAISDGFLPVTNREETKSSVSQQGFLIVKSISFDIDPVEFTHDEDIKILGSNILYANLRIFNDSVPETEYNNILKETTIENSANLLLADNCNKQLFATKFWNVNFK